MPKKMNWVERLKKKVMSYFKKERELKEKKDHKTVRTKVIEKGLRQSGMTEADIARFQGKKKKKGGN